MKKNKFDFLKKFIVLFGLLPVFLFTACSEDEDPVLEDPVAIFNYEINEDNFYLVTFENLSLNATSYSWNFGDGNSSTEENPNHAYTDVGTYDVTLTASNEAGVSSSTTQTIEIKDPDEALALLAGEHSKTWRLHRIGQSMGIGESLEDPYEWWFLENDGSRPCKYFWEYTFTRDMEYIFDDNGSFWAEFEIWGGVPDYDDTPQYEQGCFEAVPQNMVNVFGDDVSAWLSGTHQFEYDPSTNEVTLIGEGAWIGLSKCGTDGHHSVPQNSVSFKINIEEYDGYDLMIVHFVYDWGVWEFTYASYSDPSLEPDVQEEPDPIDDIGTITPTEMFITFASREADQMATIDTVTSGSSVIFGVEDPLDANEKVGEFIRTAGVDWQELQFRVTPEPKDIQFDNFTVAKIDIYIPADTDFSGGLNRHFVFGFADMSHTAEWWNSPVQFVFENDDVVLGQWTTYEFDLTDVKARDDLDMIYLGIGGGGHGDEGIFYVRNLIFE